MALTRRATVVVFGFTLALSTSSATAAVPEANGAERYFAQTLATVDRVIASAPALTASAEAMAGRFVSEGLPIAADGDPVAEYEIVTRCGGLMSLLHLPRVRDPQWRGIVLYALRGAAALDADRQRLETLKRRGCTLVVVGRAELLGKVDADWKLPNGVEGDDGLLAGLGGRVVGTADVENIATLWAWTGEFVAACTRLGRMPTMYKGYAFPGGYERAATLRGRTFHDETPTPIAPGRCAKEYLTTVRGLLVDFHGRELAHIKSAAATLAAKAAAGGTLYCFADSHPVGKSFARPVDPRLFRQLGDWTPEKVVRQFGPGDAVLEVGYVKDFASNDDPELYRRIAASGATVIWSCGATGGRRPALAPADALWIDQGWPDGDAVIDVPGYDVRILPSSGVIQATLFGMINAEMLAPSTK